MNDGLSPILVKELRQAVRSRLFTGSFLLVHVLLFVFGLWLVSSATLQSEPRFSSYLFWSFLILPLLILVPVAAGQSVEREIAGNTIELLLLTRLSAYRIVLGKWASVIVQTALLLATILPYVLLRYFLGGVDVWSELRWLGALLLASSLLAGIALGFWTARMSKWLKVGIAFLLFWLLQVAAVVLLMPHGLGLRGGGSSALWLFPFIAMLLALEVAAQRIAPPAENHATRIRLLALAAIGSLFLIQASSVSIRVFAVATAAAIVLPILMMALNERTKPIPRLYAPFTARRGVLRWLSFPFCPGWPGGLAFALLALALFALVPVPRRSLDAVEWTGVAATLLLPAALTRSLFPRVRKKAGLYFLFLFASSAPIYAWGFLRGSLLLPVAEKLQLAGGFFPPFALFLELSQRPGYAGELWVRGVLGAVTLASLALCLRAARRDWREIAALGRSPRLPQGIPSAAAAADGAAS